MLAAAAIRCTIAAWRSTGAATPTPWNDVNTCVREDEDAAVERPDYDDDRADEPL